MRDYIMRIGLYRLEHFTNFALEKIRIYYQSGKHTVDYISPVESTNYDIVYCSSLFDYTNKQYILPNMIKGGTGFFKYDTILKQYAVTDDAKLNLPPEIESVEPHINLGFTVRGCCNNCPFCVVRTKEGDINIVGDTLSLWDGKSELVTYYDNNILATPEHFGHNASQAIQYNIIQDYNQGLDHRKLTPDIVDTMKRVKHKEYHFAFDNPKSIATVEYAISLLQSKGINRCNWYVLCGYDTTHEEDLFRLNYLRSRNQNAYVQRFKNKQNNKDKRLITLARWANQHRMFQGMTWEQFLKHPDNVSVQYLLNEGR